MNKTIKYIGITICTCLILWVFPSGAASLCYYEKDAEAIAALQYHAELRIVGLSCQSSAGGKSLYPLYQTFTANNASLLKSYQDDLLSYYRRTEKGDPAKLLHTKETEIENQVSLSAAKEGIVNFCQQNSDQLQKAVLASATEVQKAIANFSQNHPPQEGFCKNSQQ